MKGHGWALPPALMLSLVSRVQIKCLSVEYAEGCLYACMCVIVYMCDVCVQVLQQAMSLTDRQSEPQNEEASRVLKFFMSTLLNGSMKPPQPLDKMRSLTTVRPFFPNLHFP